ncbi:MAG TPA: transcription antitermination factor NusB [Bacteroidota bacterium]|jgi:N utilization substance protein B|nr:transcription antitermination factor NusB [Bacteroidota bacterium]
MATSNRRLIRQRVLQALYAYELSKEPISNVMDMILADLKSHKQDLEFAKALITEVITHHEEIEAYIRTKVDHWEFDRIAVVDRVVLRMGICELLYFQDIPPKVTINESIEVAKLFSTENSGKFINGVLDAVLEDLKSRNALVKTGRGLINKNIHDNKPRRPGKGT